MHKETMEGESTSLGITPRADLIACSLLVPLNWDVRVAQPHNPYPLNAKSRSRRARTAGCIAKMHSPIRRLIRFCLIRSSYFDMRLM